MSGNKFKTNDSTNKWLNNLTNKLSKSVICLEILGHFGPILAHFWAHYTAQSNFLKKKSFKGTLMAISILFRGNLWKMSQQICVNLVKTAILG